MKASKGGKAKKGARRARKAAPKPGAFAGKGSAGTKGTAVAGGAAKPDAARVRAWRLDGRQGVYLHKSLKRWEVKIHYGELLNLGYFKTKEDAIACRLLAEDRIAAGCHPKTGKYVPEAERPKPPKPKNNTHLLGAPAATFSDAALGERATDFAAKVDAGTLDIDQVAGVHLKKGTGKWYAGMRYNNTKYQLGSHTSDLAEAIRRRLLAEKAIALFPDKNPQDYVDALADVVISAHKFEQAPDASLELYYMVRGRWFSALDLVQNRGAWPQVRRYNAQQQLQPRHGVGQLVRKKFGAKYFLGIVAFYDATPSAEQPQPYQVVFEDGDADVISDEAELAKLSWHARRSQPA